MKFKPLSKKYQFNDTLTLDFPDFMHQPVANWIYELLRSRRLLVEPDGFYRQEPYLTNDFRERLHVNFREVFPTKWNRAISFILSDTDRTTMMLQWCLSHYADQKRAKNLEWILSNGGSGYEVTKTDVEAAEYAEGVYDLTERVSGATKEAAKLAFNSNSELLDAWRDCYGREPNYNSTTQRCQNVLEGLFRDKYLPKDTKAQLGKLIKDIQAKGITLGYKGSSVPNTPNVFIEMICNIPQYRGLHKAGTGKDSSKKEAEYILQATILIWNMHQK